MINKKGIWFITLFTLILVLSVYYVTMPSELLLSNHSDYTEKKNVKKPNGSKPGFVVYYTNYSLVIGSDIAGLQQVED